MREAAADPCPRRHHSFRESGTRTSLQQSLVVCGAGPWQRSRRTVGEWLKAAADVFSCAGTRPRRSKRLPSPSAPCTCAKQQGWLRSTSADIQTTAACLLSVDRRTHEQAPHLWGAGVAGEEAHHPRVLPVRVQRNGDGRTASGMTRAPDRAGNRRKLGSAQLRLTYGIFSGLQFSLFAALGCVRAEPQVSLS